jgi:hypothetical protein
VRRVRFALAALLLATAALVVVAGSAAAADDINIRYANSAFSPNPAIAHVGDHLHFCNDSDASISITIEGHAVNDIAPNTCKGNLIVDESDAEAGALSYHCVDPCSANGVVMVQQAPTTTAATPTTVASPPAATATTRRPTATTARRATATTRRLTATSLDVTTTSEETTTTFFDTTTSELTTTTFGDLAINEERAGEDGTAVVVIASLVVIAAGGAYLIWRNRFRFR